MYEKYKCIRCLKDNRLEDGQLVSIDQCFNCTRFEPNIGAVYEILNEKGSNLAQILDDNQMSYSNMQEYTKFVKTDQYTEALDDYETGASNVKTRNPKDQDFEKVWSQGVKMDWKLVPVEEQKPHIGWRQSINDDGSYLKSHKLSSYQYSAENMGSAFGKTGAQSIWKINKDAMDANQDSELQQPISAGKSYVSGAIQDTINGMKAKDWIKSVKEQCSSAGIKLSPTALGVMAIAENNSSQISTVISKVQQIEAALSADNIDNQIITVTCYAIPDGTQYFLSTSPKAIDKLSTNKPDNKDDSKDDGKKDDNKKETDKPTESKPALDRKNINSWKWVEFAKYLAKLTTDGLEMCPKVCYTYDELNKYANDAATGIEAGFAVWGGQTMPHVREGCVEAVVRIGSYYSPFLKAEYDAGVAYVPTLEEDAAAAGVPIVDFDESQLECGDTIVYTNQEHVVIATGNGYEYVGNSSSREQVIRGSDYREMGWEPPIYPVRIIKTSQA